MSPNLVLVVVDALHPEMLKRAMETGSAPTFAALAERGELIEDCISSFPSVTPVASAEICTGVGASEHWIVGMNWYHRVERRYVEYGSSFEATRTFGLFRAMYDLVYNMNLAHLSTEVETIFERLGDAGVRTACTPFLIYRGRRRHQLSLEGLARRVAAAAQFRHAVWGPDELFYGDLYASTRVPCGPSLTRPGTRDEYSTCVAEQLIERELYEFMLYSLPDNDFHSHRFGPEATFDSIAKADASFARVVDAGGGMDAFLEQNAVVLCADHAQTAVEHALPLAELLGEDWTVLEPNAEQPQRAALAVSPTARAANVYLLRDQPRRGVIHERVRATLRDHEGVDLVAWLADSEGMPLVRTGLESHDPARVEAVVERGDLELRFRPGGQIRDTRGAYWSVRGLPETLEADVTRGRFESEVYPDSLARLWSALVSPHAGDIMVSAALGYECVDWGGVSHVGGGSHGSLHRDDSLAPLLFVGCGPSNPHERAQWALRDIAPVMLEHFDKALVGSAR
jgi:hypothetical protein